MRNTATHTLAKNVRHLKDAEGLSQQKLAKRAGISQAAVGYLLNYQDEQDRHPTTQTVEALAKAFGLQAWQLMHPTLGTPGHADTGRAPAALNDERLRAAIEGAANAFRAAGKLPTEAHLAAAATYLYAYTDNSVRLKQALRVVQQQLAKAAGKPVFPTLDKE